MSDVAEGLPVNRSSLQTGTGFARSPYAFLLSKQASRSLVYSVHLFTLFFPSFCLTLSSTPKARDPRTLRLSGTTQGCLLDFFFFFPSCTFLEHLFFLHFPCECCSGFWRGNLARRSSARCWAWTSASLGDSFSNCSG